MSADGYITREEIAEVVGLLYARPGEPNKSVRVQATTINGTHENPLRLNRAWVEVREMVDEAHRDAARYGGDWQMHMPNRPELVDVEHGDDYDFDTGEGTKTYSYPEDYDEAEDRRVALDIIRKLAARFPLTVAERNSL